MVEVIMDNKKVYTKDTGKYGKGLFAKGPIGKNEAIAVFDGKVYVATAASQLPNDPPLYVQDHAIQIGQNEWRDTEGIGRYFSHSCEPNCGMKDNITVVTMRDVAPGEELSFDYAMTEDSDWEMYCLCGTKSCRKIIKGYRYLPDSFRRKYEGYISPWLTQ